MEGLETMEAEVASEVVAHRQQETLHLQPACSTHWQEMLYHAKNAQSTALGLL